MSNLIDITDVLDPASVSLQPTGTFQLAGSELTIASLDDTDVEASLRISPDCAQSIYTLLAEAGLPRDEEPRKSVASHFATSLSGNPAAPRSPLLLERMYRYLLDDWRAAVDSAEEHGSEVTSPIICTYFEVDTNFTREDFLKHLDGGSFPPKVMFTLSRVIAKPLRRKISEDSFSEKPTLGTSVICRLRYTLEARPQGNGFPAFILAYSTSMSVATDRVSSKYEAHDDTYSVAGLALVMFLRPLRELTRLAYRLSRPRKNRAADTGRDYVEEEAILNHYQALNERPGEKDRIPFSDVWMLTDDGTSTAQVLSSNERNPLVSNLEAKLLRQCRLSSVVLSTSIYLSPRNSSTRFDPKASKLFFDRVTSCLRTPFEVQTATDRATRLKVKPMQVRLRTEDPTKRVKRKGAASPDLDEFAGTAELTNEDTTLDLYTNRADGYGRLYTVSFRTFDHNKLLRELSIADDLVVDQIGKTTKRDFLRQKVEQYASTLEVKLHVYSGALSRKGALGAQNHGVRSAADLINHLDQQKEDLRDAFRHDFEEAFRLINLDYWFKPHKWMESLIHEDQFVKMCKKNIFEKKDQLPDHFQFDADLYRWIVKLAYDLRNSRLLKRTDEQKESLKGRLEEAKGMFVLEKVDRSGKEERRSGEKRYRIRNIPALATLLHGWMVNKKTLGLRDALACAPFLSDEVRAHYGLDNLHVYNRRVPALLKELSDFIKERFHIDPAYPFAIQEDIFTNYHRYFFDVSGDQHHSPVEEKFWDWQEVWKVLPMVAKSAAELTNDTSPTFAEVSKAVRRSDAKETVKVSKGPK